MPFLTLAAYRWLTRALYPALWLWDAWRAQQQAIYRPYRHERWGRDLPTPLNAALGPQTRQPIVWIHAVSVGETQACAPLLLALLAQHPDCTVLLTHMTPTGRDAGAALFAAQIANRRVQQCYLPYDLASLSARFLKHFRPAQGIIVETEVWPNIVATCAQLGVPLGLANGRLSDKTLRTSLRFKALANPTYQAFTWVAAQSVADAARFERLRTKAITVTGNLKFDVTPDAQQLARGHAFKASQQRLCIALASTREGEEVLLLEQLQRWYTRQAKTNAAHAKGAQTPLPLLLLIPRHPKRVSEILDTLQSQGWRYCQRSAGQTPQADTQVYVCDTLGEMWFYYGASDIAVVGGGWLPHGGQNLIEPCMAACAVVVGPHMFNFAHATQLAVQQNAVIQCSDVMQLSTALDDLNHAAARANYAAAGLAFAAQHTGAAKAHLALMGHHGPLISR